jgi:tRNA (Thr-GGU) A37 N-methylase
MSALNKINLDPVAFVKTEAVDKEVRDKTVISQIVFREEYTEALEGIEGFSHMFVLFWLHEMSDEDRRIMKVHPRGRNDMPLLGIFATRTPHRNVVTIQGLDAFNGTPVLDIKPFDSWDITEDFKVPEWWKKLEKEGKTKKE